MNFAGTDPDVAAHGDRLVQGEGPRGLPDGHGRVPGDAGVPQREEHVVAAERQKRGPKSADGLQRDSSPLVDPLGEVVDVSLPTVDRANLGGVAENISHNSDRVYISQLAICFCQIVSPRRK